MPVARLAHLATQWSVRTRVHGHVRCAEKIQHPQRIARGEVQRHVAGDADDRLQLDRWMTDGKRNSKRVVDAGVDVQDDVQLTAAGARLKAGITSVAKRSSCSRMTRSSVPTTWPTWTSSSPGYRSCSSPKRSTMRCGGPTNHAP